MSERRTAKYLYILSGRGAAAGSRGRCLATWHQTKIVWVNKNTVPDLVEIYSTHLVGDGREHPEGCHAHGPMKTPLRHHLPGYSCVVYPIYHVHNMAKALRGRSSPDIPRFRAPLWPGQPHGRTNRNGKKSARSRAIHFTGTSPPSPHHTTKATTETATNSNDNIDRPRNCQVFLTWKS